MSDENDRSTERFETAKRHDDSELIESMEDAPSHGNRSGHRVGHDIGTQDELKQAVGEGGVTRVRDSDKKEDADLPRFNQGNSNLNP
jgi:predicted metal-dependent phosphoesterase TrpH